MAGVVRRDGLREAVTKLRDKWVADEGRTWISNCGDELSAVLDAVPDVPPTEEQPRDEVVRMHVAEAIWAAAQKPAVKQSWDEARAHVDAAMVAAVRMTVEDKYANLNEAVKDLCWRLTPYGETADGDTAYYLVTKGAAHRLVGSAQGAGVSASLRAQDVPEPADTPAVPDVPPTASLPDDRLAEAEAKVQRVEALADDGDGDYIDRDDLRAALSGQAGDTGPGGDAT